MSVIIKVMDESQQVALCRCEKSSSEPFCDGSHIIMEYKSRPRAY